MKNIVIFGATGETGMYLTDYLYENLDAEEFQVIAVGRRKTTFFDRYPISYVSMDISEEKEFDKLPTEDIYAVIFLAGIMPGRMEGYDPIQYIDVNVKGLFNVLEYSRKNGVEKILYTQTIRDIGNLIGKEVLRADTARDFSYKGDHAVYVISKNAAVDLIEHYHQEYGIKNYIFRLPTIYLYSPNEYYYVDGVKRIMGFRHLINQAIKGEKIEIWGDPERAHDVVYVKDLCQVFLNAIVLDGETGVYNIGTGIPVSLREQIEGIIKVFSPAKKRSDIVFCPEKTNARDYRIDISKTIRNLQYSPKYDYLSYLYDFKEEMEKNRFNDLSGE